jgi:hypothetical protein
MLGSEFLLGWYSEVGGTMQVACRSRLPRARWYLTVVRGSAWEAASCTSRSGTPTSKLVESNVPTTLNTSTGAGTLGLFPGLVMTVAG